MLSQSNLVVIFSSLLASCLLPGGYGFGQESQADVTPLCGPKCIDFILKSYELPSPGASTLSLQLQPDLHKGLSLDDMRNYLQGCGIATRVVSVPRGAKVSTKWLSVVCRPSPDPHRLGHYFVLCPSDGEEVQIWDPSLYGRTCNYENELFPHKENLLMLTKPAEVSEEDYGVRISRRPWLSFLTAIGLSIAGVLVMFSVRFFK